MTEQEFRALLNLFMSADPWPASTEDHTVIEDMLNKEAEAHKYDGWIEAFHGFLQDDA